MEDWVTIRNLKVKNPNIGTRTIATMLGISRNTVKKTLIYTTNPIESLNSTIKRKTKSKGSFPTVDSAFKMLYLSTQEVQIKWEKSSMRNWSEIYPQLCIFFSEIMEKYTK